MGLASRGKNGRHFGGGWIPVAILADLVYLLLLTAAAPWLFWRAARRGRYRRGWAAKLLGQVPRVDSDRPLVWLHAVSVGEVNLLGPVLAELVRRRPLWQYVISTSTDAGYDLARTRYAQHQVIWCPLDFSWAVRRALRRLNPRLLVLAELELWPNLIRAAQARGTRVAVINGRLSQRSFRGYRRLARWLAPTLRSIDRVVAQNATYAERFRALGVPEERVSVSGSVKFDGAATDRMNSATQRLARLAGFAPDDVVWLAGSTQAPEESLALAAFAELAPQFPRLRLVLVPRQPHRFDEVAALLDLAPFAWQRRSTLGESPTAAEASASPARALLVDTVGELGAWWGTADLAFVGGSLGQRGGQNMIEPAAYGAAVCFGPNTRNFRDVVELLLKSEAAVVVRDGAELAQFIRRGLEDPAWAARLGERARQLVATQLGATGRTVDLLLDLVDQPVAGQARVAA